MTILDKFKDLGFFRPRVIDLYKAPIKKTFSEHINDLEYLSKYYDRFRETLVQERIYDYRFIKNVTRKDHYSFEYYDHWVTHRFLEGILDDYKYGSGRGEAEEIEKIKNELKIYVELIVHKNKIKPEDLLYELYNFKEKFWAPESIKLKEMMVEVMQYVGEKKFFALHIPLYNKIRSDISNGVWDNPLQPYETEASRNQGIDESSQKVLRDILEIQRPYYMNHRLNQDLPQKEEKISVNKI